MMTRSKNLLLLISILLLGAVFILLAEYFFEIQPNNLIACPEETTEPCEDEDLSDETDTESPDFVACTMDAKECPDGSFVGRVGPNCDFQECPAVTPEEPTVSKTIVCSEESKQVDACIEIYQPVCGLVEVQCITTPCPPVKQTFGNSCNACAQGNVISYEVGECEGGA